LHHGRLLASGAASRLSREFLGVRYRLSTTQPDHPALADQATRGVSVVSSSRRDDGAPGWHDVLLRMDLDHDPSDVLAVLSAQGMRIAAFEPIRPSLADLIEGVVRRGVES
jgi:hypothetical protein